MVARDEVCVGARGLELDEEVEHALDVWPAVDVIANEHYGVCVEARESAEVRPETRQAVQPPVDVADHHYLASDCRACAHAAGKWAVSGVEEARAKNRRFDNTHQETAETRQRGHRSVSYGAHDTHEVVDVSDGPSERVLARGQREEKKHQGHQCAC